MEKQVSEQPKEVNIKVRNKMTEKNKKQEIEKEKNNQTHQKDEQVSKKIDNETDKPLPKKDEESVNKEKITEPSGEAIKKPSDSEESKKKNDKKEVKKPVKPVVKKSEAVVNATNLQISAKYSIAICKFIKNKKIEKAIDDLEQVLMHKKAIPMKGEIPHRKGKGIMSGRYPKKASENFIKLLKNLQANANNHEVNNPIITEAISNQASRPFGRFGRVKRKRTHVKIVAREKKLISKNKKPKEKKKHGRKKHS